MQVALNPLCGSAAEMNDTQELDPMGAPVPQAQSADQPQQPAGFRLLGALPPLARALPQQVEATNGPAQEQVDHAIDEVLSRHNKGELAVPERFLCEITGDSLSI